MSSVGGAVNSEASGWRHWRYAAALNCGLANSWLIRITPVCQDQLPWETPSQMVLDISWLYCAFRAREMPSAGSVRILPTNVRCWRGDYIILRRTHRRLRLRVWVILDNAWLDRGGDCRERAFCANHAPHSRPRSSRSTWKRPPSGPRRSRLQASARL
jgi:hypothetical protein